MIRTRAENAEVLYPDEDVVLAGAADWQELKRLAALNPRRRVRLCTHRSPDDALHEMLIVHTRETYVPPHKHLGKSESFSVLEGELDLVLFREDGRISRVIPMGAPATGKASYCRPPEGTYHSLLIHSEFLVFHEVTQGPFRREQTVMAPWIPAGDDDSRRKALLAAAEKFRQTGPHPL